MTLCFVNLDLIMVVLVFLVDEECSRSVYESIFESFFGGFRLFPMFTVG